MGKKIAVVLVSLIILLGGAGFYGTPYLAYRNMRIAAENKDIETLSSYVDFPSLKKSVIANLNDEIARGLGGKGDGEPMDKLGAAIASAFINPMLDAFVTPEGLTMIVRGSIPDRKGSKLFSENKPGDSSEKKSSRKDSGTEASMNYENFNTFVVAFNQKGSAEDQIHLVFKRHGVVSWKLSAIKLP